MKLPRYPWIGLGLILALCRPSWAQEGPQQVPVLFELFTSEGCSSCPPADEVVVDWKRDPPLAGVDILFLAWHVDYWNRLGWTDRFSSKEYTRRQYGYAAAGRIYTPQAVIMGGEETVGHNRAKLRAMLQRASRKVGHRLDLKAERGTLRLKLLGRRPEGVLWANAAYASGPIESKVGSGENRGRLLRHQSVVLKWVKARSNQAGEWALELPKMKPKGAWIAWVETADRQVLAAARVSP